MREFCTSGSVGEAAGNCCLYPAFRPQERRLFLCVVLRGFLGYDSFAWGGSAHAERWVESQDFRAGFAPFLLKYRFSI
jgi:hypothetical protein